FLDLRVGTRTGNNAVWPIRLMIFANFLHGGVVAELLEAFRRGEHAQAALKSRIHRRSRLHQDDRCADGQDERPHRHPLSCNLLFCPEAFYANAAGCSKRWRVFIARVWPLREYISGHDRATRWRSPAARAESKSLDPDAARAAAV